MSASHVIARQDEHGSAILTKRTVTDGEIVWRRVRKADFSEDRNEPTIAAFRDQTWDSKRAELKQKYFGERAKLPKEEQAAYMKELQAAKLSREMSVDLAHEMKQPNWCWVVAGEDGRPGDRVVALQVGRIRSEAQLQVDHRPLPENVAHADILGDYEATIKTSCGPQAARQILIGMSKIVFTVA